MDDKTLLTHLDNRFDRLEDKLDDHLGRISKTENDVHWMKGAAKLGITILIPIAGFLAKYIWSHK